jgi:hypothetical protein
VFFHELARTPLQRLRLSAKKPEPAYVSLYVLERSSRKLFGIGKSSKQLWCNPIHRFVSALSRQYNRDQQLKAVAVSERAF